MSTAEVSSVPLSSSDIEPEIFPAPPTINENLPSPQGTPPPEIFDNLTFEDPVAPDVITPMKTMMAFDSDIAPESVDDVELLDDVDDLDLSSLLASPTLPKKKIIIPSPIANTPPGHKASGSIADDQLFTDLLDQDVKSLPLVSDAVSNAPTTAAQHLSTEVNDKRLSIGSERRMSVGPVLRFSTRENTAPSLSNLKEAISTLEPEFRKPIENALFSFLHFVDTEFEAIEKRIYKYEPPITDKKTIHRNRVYQEILSTEESYVNSLILMNEKFYEPLVEFSKTNKNVTSSDVSAIFGTIGMIRSCNEELVKKMKNQMKNFPYGLVAYGKIFIEHWNYLKMYTAYVNTYQSAIDTLTRIKKIKGVAALLKQIQSDTELRGLSLHSFLIMPVQRVPRYVLLLRDLVKQTATDHPDYDMLQSALEKCKGVAAYINESKRKAEGLARVTQVAEQTKPWSSKFQLIQPHRFWQHQGSVFINADTVHITQETKKSLSGHPTTGQRFIFLFNDMVLLTIPEETKKGVQYHMNAVLFLKACRLEQVSPKLKKLNPDLNKPCFILLHNKSQIFWIFESDQEQEEWENIIETNLDALHNNQQVGDASSTVPPIEDEDSGRRGSKIGGTLRWISGRKRLGDGEEMAPLPPSPKSSKKSVEEPAAAATHAAKLMAANNPSPGRGRSTSFRFRRN